MAKRIAEWKQTLNEKWVGLRFGDVKVQIDAAQHIFEAEVYFNDLDPNAVRVELYADGINGSSPIREEMTRVRRLADESGGRSIAHRPPQPVSQRTIRCASSRIMPVWRCPSKSISFSGSGESSSNGSKTMDELL